MAQWCNPAMSHHTKGNKQAPVTLKITCVSVKKEHQGEEKGGVAERNLGAWTMQPKENSTCHCMNHVKDITNQWACAC